jgi:hypothetical protein
VVWVKMRACMRGERGGARAEKRMCLITVRLAAIIAWWPISSECIRSEEAKSHVLMGHAHSCTVQGFSSSQRVNKEAGLSKNRLVGSIATFIGL